ncbi:MAG: PIN domain-containing protein [Pseudomonadota bacterium]
MKKNVILIDFESVRPASIEILSAEHFYVYVFVGANQNKVPFEIVESIHRMGARADYIKITGNGPNALDFHIAYYIGRFSADESPPFFHIISKDKGFDPLIQHLKSKKIYVARSESIEEISIVRNALIRSATERAALYIAKLNEPKVTRPRTEITLSRSIKAHFRDSIEESEIPIIIAAIQKSGFMSISDKKVVYNQVSN